MWNFGVEGQRVAFFHLIKVIPNTVRHVTLKNVNELNRALH